MAKHSDVIRHRWMKQKFEQHKHVLEKHKARGPAFKEAAERLERLLTSTPTDATSLAAGLEAGETTP